MTRTRRNPSVRTDAAANLLRDTGLTAAEIAYRAGFANPHHFSRTFKRHHGLAPGAYRKQVWAGRGTALSPTPA